MIDNQFNLVSIILIILVLINLIVLFAYYLEYRRNQKLLGISKKAHDADRLYKRSQESAHQLLNQTIEEYQLIIESAYKEANAIVSQMRKTTESIDEKTTVEMQKVVSEGKANLETQIQAFAMEFKTSLQALEKGQTAQISQLQESIYKETLNNLNQMIANLKDHSLHFQEEASQKAATEIANLQEELKVYKQQQLDQINANLYQILTSAAQKVLGEGISLSTKKETVIKALDEAKKDGLIS
jgi:vacuolar-type H+-ATPase subunit H